MQTVDIEKENKEIIRRYRKLLRHAKPFLKDDDAKIIKKAFFTSLQAHKDMRRRSGEPYIYHPLAVAQIAVEEIGLGTTSIIAALLHDVVEDTHLEISDIERDFGPKVARIIDGLTKISGVFEHGSSQQAENFRKMILTLSDDVRVILIKLADRLHNMRTLGSMPREKQLKISSETIYLYAPLAHRLGLYAIKTELEDLYLKYTDPEVYRGIARKINETKSARDKFITDFIEPLQTALDKSNFDFIVKGRPKSIYSIWNKIRKQNTPFEEVYDLFAIRIIIDTPYENEKAACWKAYSIVTDFYKPNPDRLRDWISTPKANGYESLHTTVMSKSGQWVEVQIRTKRMDDIAEKGYAAHWKYKEATQSKSESGLEEWIKKVRELIETNDSSALEFMDDFRTNLFHEEVFVFTPKGDLKILPHGATTLDFAFEIHTQIGMHCLGAKVNQKLVPLSYILNNGDQVEILTSSKQKPSEDWLKFVVSSKARAKIKDSLKEEKKKIASDGKEIVLRKLHQMKLDLNAETLNQLLIYFNMKFPLDLYYDIAKGIIDPKEIKKFQEPKEVKKPEKKEVVEPKPQEPKKTGDANADLLLIGDDMEKIDYKLAKCCNPIPGDDVFGFVTVNEGIKIHRTTCPNAIELMSHYGYRVVKAKWTAQKELAFLTGLKINGMDRVGIVNDITRIISNELKVNMRSITIETEDGMFEGRIMLFVHDTKHLNKLIMKLKKVQDVITVNRFES
ncbi:MAG: bifunctional (p)ppGpp synthetase/guanosine-3',5'-bis(diphosphate) 3'-pyrophosphohydrolase [Sporocytophaga sp.]|uniref:RelA/SpoT family protein n=1 Tax=Sporocytophaga sp. TaxID=2231183 RepID=UPI001B18FA05|nr:bifunctional (p)ppGpp synthetase/guanosine-3',5'-bis(diphosphate) 3'-pyrophosphohydrolase [Sporocytophaga sp.]MBO9702512.1 bifunctional (p)ppGpp synthetase/guanosine-3',5'-bis(diphosphate) 3'-pyrophosphohydrolase [Sporocytophaga sp.]